MPEKSTAADRSCQLSCPAVEQSTSAVLGARPVSRLSSTNVLVLLADRNHLVLRRNARLVPVPICIYVPRRAPRHATRVVNDARAVTTCAACCSRSRSGLALLVRLPASLALRFAHSDSLRLPVLVYSPLRSRTRSTITPTSYALSTPFTCLVDCYVNRVRSFHSVRTLGRLLRQTSCALPLRLRLPPQFVSGLCSKPQIQK
ncbi:uncharacterized protein PITG_10495 [Phytophthora infestans T30-4]|uniref:Uncharacterized protein n=1 Tax=Phytophthora infestans (strain T30-4) TaxID=403677 RepID=D0NFG1_PHYIT|nr:uncharacterized protein PITG_10495 [Phytophthora infestans T30-4]EEY56950.1 hypothetical protein PITG_10495 [Phytophthora infestans T30-4]|eukprot:XP_002902278.1 hypothetical protein PITG_10495 [Phytophthora infestans T30-4]